MSARLGEVSDGVFEFLTSQTVCNLTGDFEDPFDACRAVVHESHRMWLLYEVRTDDITMVCIQLHFDSAFKGQQTGAAPAPAWDVEQVRSSRLG